MSGPYPPQGYPQQPAQGGWGGQVGGGPGGPYGPSSYPGGWHQQPQQDQPAWHGSAPEPTPPPRKRNTGQIIAAVVASLVIVGGVITGVVLLHNHHQAQQQANPPTSAPAVTSQQQQQQQPQTEAPGATNASGSTALTVSAGQCATATTNGSSYRVTKLAQCGAASSDFVLNKTVPQVSGCAAQQYVVITGPAGAVYCFTIDAKAGDCLNNFYLKVQCGAAAAFTVLKTEAGPGSDASCRTVTGAQRWVPSGYPAQVACLGPSGSS
jgi:hypothetical protein